MLGDNAALLQIKTESDTDDFGDAIASGAILWQGRASCHLIRTDRRVVSGGLSTNVRTETLVVRRLEAPALEVAGDEMHGSTVLVEDRRSQPYTQRQFVCTGVENRVGGTIADSVRLELEVEQPGGE